MIFVMKYNLIYFCAVVTHRRSITVITKIHIQHGARIHGCSFSWSLQREPMAPLFMRFP